ncbi:MAG: hypothetical protein KKA16_03415 [Alphaproteobacteria bacterium]|nr:hypothetical protein [Alphaproteobacteria bacterium]MBU2378486.1 hypothetical protein [Alphaproteobacteria bacterium]
MIGLMFALLVSPTSVMPEQAVQATLQSCAMENGRWVCRYAVPDIEIVPIPGNDIVATAPASILGEARTAETTAIEPPAPVPLATTPDAGVLTEREARLVARCADAGWMSLCLPDDRRAARALRDEENAYLTVRREVTSLLSQDRCDAAARAALDGGYLALAREARDYCVPPVSAASAD